MLSDSTTGLRGRSRARHVRPTAARRRSPRRVVGSRGTAAGTKDRTHGRPWGRAQDIRDTASGIGRERNVGVPPSGGSLRHRVCLRRAVRGERHGSFTESRRCGPPLSEQPRPNTGTTRPCRGPSWRRPRRLSPRGPRGGRCAGRFRGRIPRRPRYPSC